MTYNPDNKFAVFVNQVTGAADLKGVCPPTEGGFFVVWKGSIDMLKEIKARRILDGGAVETGAAWPEMLLCCFALLVFMVAVIGLSFVAAAFAAKGGAL